MARSLPPRYDPATGRLLPPACVPDTPEEKELLARLRAESKEFQRREHARWNQAVREAQDRNRGLAGMDW